MAKVKYTIIRANGKIEEAPSWSNTNITWGLNEATRVLYDPTRSGSVASFNFIALSSGSSLSVAATDTTLSGEAVGVGLTRASGSYSTGSATLWQVAKTFTYTGTALVTLTGSALFNNLSG